LVFKVKSDVLKKCGLDVFNDEAVMSMTFLNQIGGDIALRQESIGSNLLALNIDGVK
jgi:hypothetical protein